MKSVSKLARRFTGSRKEIARADPEVAELGMDVPSDVVGSSEVPPVPMPAPAAPAARPSSYCLADEDYQAWQAAAAAFKKDPESEAALRALADKPKLLNWRSPVNGQTLLHMLVASGASEVAVQRALDLGCDGSVSNVAGETPGMLAARKGRPSQCLSSGPSARGLGRARRPVAAAERWSRADASAPEVRRRSLGSASGLAEERRSLASASASAPAPSSSGSALADAVSSVKRRAGKKLATNETASVPKASLNVDLDMEREADLDTAELEASITKAYGGRARVQIDEVTEKRGSSSSRRCQKVKARVMFDDAGECRTWQERSATTRTVQSALATELQLGSQAVEFDAAATMDTVDSVTLKLDSDSSHILCGACLLYNDQGTCEKVVCHSDRSFWGGAVQHSGDTKVDGKSVHTIKLGLSKIPDEVTQLYFTLCSCGPADLSGFKDPSIMLFENSQPDANLLEYSINQAAKSLSCVMARMLRQPTWSPGDRNIRARLLRKLKMPLLCIDLCLAMAEESSWAIQALGTEEWNLTQKVCSNYHYGKELIQERLRTKTGLPTTADNKAVGLSSSLRGSSASASASASSSA